jgi:hypothetical protein
MSMNNHSQAYNRTTACCSLRVLGLSRQPSRQLEDNTAEWLVNPLELENFIDMRFA